MKPTNRKIFGAIFLCISVALSCLGFAQLLQPPVFRAAVLVKMNEMRLREANNLPPYEMVSKFFTRTPDRFNEAQSIKKRLDSKLEKESGGRYNLQMSEIADLFRRQIRMHPIGNTDILEIRVDSDDPYESAKIANAAADDYVELKSNMFSGPVKGTEKTDGYLPVVFKRAVPPTGSTRPRLPVGAAA
jgi:hypothetical protein